jgi:glycosyltransferase involved in cell wall biosynthesis
MRIVHLTASQFLGGPERQMLELGRALALEYRSAYVSFREGGRCAEFLAAAAGQGCPAFGLRRDTPRLWGALGELTRLLATLGADVLCCHGYKADLLGRPAARRLGIPAVAVSRGWTGERLRVRLYEAADRLNLRWMDRVVCVSAAQADKVVACGVPASKVRVIRNAIRADRFGGRSPALRAKLLACFGGGPRLVVGAAGRLSPEKGFGMLVDAARLVRRANPAVAFALYGDGRLREALLRQVSRHDLEGSFILRGHTRDLDTIFPCFDLFVLPSYTEGLPNVALEACAAGVPVVATAVGGTPEVVEDGVNGLLVPPGDAAALARRILDLADSDSLRAGMSRAGRQVVQTRFTFEEQARQYQELFEELGAPARARDPEGALRA